MSWDWKQHTKLLDGLVAEYVTPILKPAGFRKPGPRRFVAGEPPGNLVIVQLRPFHCSPDWVSFHIEWSVIPSNVCEFMNPAFKRSSIPQITWGIISSRVAAPAELFTGLRSLWADVPHFSGLIWPPAFAGQLVA